MMFRLNKTAHSLIMATLILCSCSQAEDDAISKGKTDESYNVVFRLQSNSSNTTRSVEDSYSHVQGTANEYKVNNATVYFFDTTSKLFARSVQHYRNHACIHL